MSVCLSTWNWVIYIPLQRLSDVVCDALVHWPALTRTCITHCTTARTGSGCCFNSCFVLWQAGEMISVTDAFHSSRVGTIFSRVAKSKPLGAKPCQNQNHYQNNLTSRTTVEPVSESYPDLFCCCCQPSCDFTNQQHTVSFLANITNVLSLLGPALLKAKRFGSSQHSSSLKTFEISKIT